MARIGATYWVGEGVLELAFETENLRHMCEHEAVALKQLGQLAADALRNRLSDLHTADFIDEVLAGRPRHLSMDGVDCVQFELVDRWTLTVSPDHVPPRNTRDGHSDWSRVRRIKIIRVEQA